MIPAEEGALDTYQWRLRALGSYLDSEPSYRVCLVEIPDGFLVRLQRGLYKFEVQDIRFDHDKLREQLDALFQRHKWTASAHRGGIWQAFPNGHADFFRALGYELDQESARDVLIEELDDGMLVLYSKPADGGWQRRMVNLSVADVEKILNAAFERRRAVQS